MQLKPRRYSITDPEKIKEQMLNWANRFNIFCLLDNHSYEFRPGRVEWLLAAGAKRQISAKAGDALEKLQAFVDEKEAWLFGHLGYDLKNEIEALSSPPGDPVEFPDLFFFEPEVILRLKGNELLIEAGEPATVYEAIIQTILPAARVPDVPIELHAATSREDYISIINQLKLHILAGDCYEINFCQQFYSAQAVIDPLNVYRRLSDLSPNPFSALYKLEDKWLVCASPERFMYKEGARIISQPIKGTTARVAGNSEADQQSREALLESRKDRSENVMIVDLVRNDLSRICGPSSVKVDELFGVYPFPQVYQMISTISGELRPGTRFADIVRAIFPMGSMTGAPKKRVMELISQYEKSGRGIFSGALGYIDPDGDFDFNVIIRSIMYNESNKFLSILAGSGITFYSEAEKEWEECEMKVAAMKKAVEAEKA